MLNSVRKIPRTSPKLQSLVQLSNIVHRHFFSIFIANFKHKYKLSCTVANLRHRHTNKSLIFAFACQCIVSARGQRNNRTVTQKRLATTLRATVACQYSAGASRRGVLVLSPRSPCKSAGRGCLGEERSGPSLGAQVLARFSSEDCSRASTRKICPKRGPRKSHEKATKK